MDRSSPAASITIPRFSSAKKCRSQKKICILLRYTEASNAWLSDSAAVVPSLLQPRRSSCKHDSFEAANPRLRATTPASPSLSQPLKLITRRVRSLAASNPCPRATTPGSPSFLQSRKVRSNFVRLFAAASPRLRASTPVLPSFGQVWNCRVKVVRPLTASRLRLKACTPVSPSLLQPWKNSCTLVRTCPTSSPRPRASTSVSPSFSQIKQSALHMCNRSPHIVAVFSVFAVPNNS
mmetsp:Transcript_15852/g.34937  ORF Transcript_15852/g.34937 Transcript_15852/m.34937 type:complete len:236 (-) Transcript_15852:113-820(-)